jgi:hypothetical protein
MVGWSGRGWRIEPFNEFGELIEHSGVVAVGMLADEVDHNAVAVGCLSAVAARLVDYSEAVPAVCAHHVDTAN